MWTRAESHGPHADRVAVFICLFLCVGWGLYYGSYTFLETWIIGVVLLFSVIAATFISYAPPWGLIEFLFSFLFFSPGDRTHDLALARQVLMLLNHILSPNKQYCEKLKLLLTYYQLSPVLELTWQNESEADSQLIKQVWHNILHSTLPYRSSL